MGMLQLTREGCNKNRGLPAISGANRTGFFFFKANHPYRPRHPSRSAPPVSDTVLNETVKKWDREWPSAGVMLVTSCNPQNESASLPANQYHKSKSEKNDQKGQEERP